MIDFSSKFGKRVLRRLRKESVIWLTTTGSDLTPQPRPVWFLWDGQTFLIYSEPNRHKVRHIAAHPNVSLNLNSDEDGGDVVVLTGRAQVMADHAPADQVPAYVKKYRKGIADLKMTPSELARDYSVAIQVTPTKLRGL